MRNLPPIVFSTSAIIAWKRCRKSFELSYILNRDTPSSDAAEMGTNFHGIVEAAARGESLQKFCDEPMYAVAAAYLAENPLPSGIIDAEQPMFTKVLDSDGVHGDVYVRTTHDLVYRDDGNFIVGRDYKTFEKWPTHDLDLDFQGRTYMAALMAHYRTRNARFEWEYVRRTPPHLYDSSSKWLTTQCYSRIEIVYNEVELAVMWLELKDTVRDMLRSIDEKRFYRTDLKGNFHGCSSCFPRHLCAAEIRNGGTLSKDDMDILSVPRDEAARMTTRGIAADPRVTYWALEYEIAAAEAPNDGPADPGECYLEAVRTVYGDTGVALVKGAVPV